MFYGIIYFKYSVPTQRRNILSGKFLFSLWTTNCQMFTCSNIANISWQYFIEGIPPIVCFFVCDKSLKRTLLSFTSPANISNYNNQEVFLSVYLKSLQLQFNIINLEFSRHFHQSYFIILIIFWKTQIYFCL